jgi:hypothetical protein
MGAAGRARFTISRADLLPMAGAPIRIFAGSCCNVWRATVEPCRHSAHGLDGYYHGAGFRAACGKRLDFAVDSKCSSKDANG